MGQRPFDLVDSRFTKVSVLHKGLFFDKQVKDIY